MIKDIRIFVSSIGTNRHIQYIFTILFFYLLSIILFWNNFFHGIQFDEVYRVNNLIPFFNPYSEPYTQAIFSINIFGTFIPIAYKSYISSATLLPHVPLFFWDDYLMGIRDLYVLYFFLSIIVFFIILSRFVNFKFSFLTSLLLATSPILFPEIRFGFAYSLHIVILSIAFYFLYLFKLKKKPIYLFMGIFLLFAGANIYFYFLWVIASLLITSIIFYKDFWKEILFSPKNVFVIVSALTLGFINFILYNLYSDFASFKPLISRIFFPSEYELNPIDYKFSPPLIEDIIRKFDAIMNFFGDFGYIYLAIGTITLLLFGLVTIKLIKQNRLYDYKNYYFCLVNSILILAFILITPNTTRAGHYCFLIPFIQLTILSLVLLSTKIYKLKNIHVFGVAIFIILISLNGFITGGEITQSCEDRGKGYFSPAIFDLDEYIDKHQIDSKNILFVQWGMYSQLYFLNKGEFTIKSLVFQFLGAEDSQERVVLLEKFLISNYIENEQEELYFPIYKGLDTKSKQIYEDTLSSLSLHGGKIDLIATFNETNGEPLIYLFKLSNTGAVVKNIQKSSTPIYKYGRVMSFERNGTADQYQIAGWSNPEKEFTWTDGHKAVLAIKPENPNSDLAMTITASPYLGGGKIKQQQVTIKVNGQTVDRWVFDQAGIQEKRTIIPCTILTGEVQLITLELLDAKSPKELGQSGDVRVLGLAVRSLVIDE
jgi:hypothetical protein